MESSHGGRVYSLYRAAKGSKVAKTYQVKAQNKQFKKLMKKHKKKQERKKLPLKILKNTAKLTGYGVSYIAQNSMGKRYISPIVAKEVTDVVANNTAKLAKGVKTRLLGEVGHINPFFSKKKTKEEYDKRLLLFAKETEKTAKKVNEILRK